MPSAIHEAASNNDWRLVQVLLDTGTFVDERVNKNEWDKALGGTPLIFAAKSGSLQVIKILCKHGADLEARSNHGDTALHYASEFRHVPVVEFLLKQGSKVDPRNNHGETPFFQNISARLIDSSSSMEIPRLLLKNGADLFAEDSDGRTALHVAGCRGNLELAYMLVHTYGCDMNPTTINGETPLHGAAMFGHSAAAYFLLQHGAEIGARMFGIEIIADAAPHRPEIPIDELTPLHLASMFNHFGVVAALLYHGADPLARDDIGATPLHHACMNNHLHIVESLVWAADKVGYGLESLHIPMKNNSMTPLLIARDYGHEDVYRFLLKFVSWRF